MDSFDACNDELTNSLEHAVSSLQAADKVRERRRSRWERELWNIDLRIESALASLRGTVITVGLITGVEVQGTVEFVGVDVAELSTAFGVIWIATYGVATISSEAEMHHEPAGIAATTLDDVLDALTEEDHPVRIFDQSGKAQVGTIRAGDYTVAINPINHAQPRMQRQRLIMAKEYVVAVERSDRLESVRIF